MNYSEYLEMIETYATEYMREKENYCDAHQYAAETADSCQEVIYYARSWDLVNLIRVSDRDALYEAEDLTYENGYSCENIDNTMTHLAYWLIYNELSNRIYELESEAA
jgi:hypothetical protein